MTQHDTGRIRVATGTGVTLALAAASVATASTAHAEEHTVRKGETVSHIAARSGVSVAAIARANNLADPGRIMAGQRLVIPTGVDAPGKSEPRKKKAAAPKSATHTVAPGDTVSHLASRYGTSVGKIVKANGLDSRAFIVVGQELTIPGASSSEAPKKKKTTKAKKATSTTYEISPGDTVSSIAARFGTSVSAIVKA